MTLQETLNRMKAEFEESAPPEALAVMHQATRELTDSGLLDNTLKTGDTAPDFSLEDQNGTPLASRDLLAQGPLVLGFYRGVW